MKKEEVILEPNEGDIIIADREPYIIEDEAILTEIKYMRDHGKDTGVVGDTKITLLEDFKGKVLRKTKVHLDDA